MKDRSIGESLAIIAVSVIFALIGGGLILWSLNLLAAHFPSMPRFGYWECVVFSYAIQYNVNKGKLE